MLDISISNSTGMACRECPAACTASLKEDIESCMLEWPPILPNKCWPVSEVFFCFLSPFQKTSTEI